MFVCAVFTSLCCETIKFPVIYFVCILHLGKELSQFGHITSVTDINVTGYSIVCTITCFLNDLTHGSIIIITTSRS